MLLSQLNRLQALELYKQVLKDHDAKTMRRLCKEDLFFLLVIACKRVDMNRDWLFARCREVESNPDGYLDLWSREHYKSSIITFGMTIKDILNDPEVTVGIFSHTRPIAKSFLSQIKRELETNQFIKDLFPDVLYANPQKDSPRWSLDDGIIVKRKGNPKESTIEAWGLVDGQPTSKHYSRLVYDDVVTKESVSTPEMIAKVTDAFGLSLNLAGNGCRKRYIGTRYHACLVAKTRILMSDWSHKSISDIKVGDEIVGWEKIDSKGSNQFRKLRKSKVTAIGKYENEVVKEYKFDCGRSITSTPTHRWWRGPHGSGEEYKELGLHYHKMGSVRRLLDPSNVDNSRESGWLAGFFDGEGSYRKNSFHPSGTINITQTMLNPCLINKTREILNSLGFEYSESWTKDIKTKKGNTGFDKCVFNICGGWRERYRFLTQVNPYKRQVISDTLYGQMLTDKATLVEVIDRPNEDVYWFETETGNYIAEGFCSRNSDTYKSILDRGTAIPRIYPATDDGTLTGKPVLMTQEQFNEKLRDMGSYLSSCQLLQNPLADSAMGFKTDWICQYAHLSNIQDWNIYILVDPAGEKKKTNDYTVFTVIGLAPDGNYYLMDGCRDRLNLTERTKKLFSLVRKWKPRKVGYEKYGLQSDIEHIKYVQDQEGYRFDIIALGGSMAKNDRIRRLIPIFENHRFYIPYSTIFIDNEGKAKDFIKMFMDDEYSSFPVSTHDDMLDCMSRIVDEDLEAVFPLETTSVAYGISKRNEDQSNYDPLARALPVEHINNKNVGVSSWNQLMTNRG